MKGSVLVLCIGVASCSKPRDAAVERFLNEEFAPPHARIKDARAAYGDIRATDFDQPGKRAFLTFRVHDVAVPLLDKAQLELQGLTPPPAASAFYKTTVELVAAERAALHRMDDALTGKLPAEQFQVGRQALASLGPQVTTWTRALDQLVASAKVSLHVLPRAPLPEQQPVIDAGAMVPTGP